MLNCVKKKNYILGKKGEYNENEKNSKKARVKQANHSHPWKGRNV
jgi:hypothetical protein